MTKLILTGDLNNAQLGFQQGWGYGMLALGIGGFANKFPTPNADLNSNNLMAALTRDGVSNALLSSWNPYAMMAGAAVKVIDKTGGFSNVSEGLGTGNDIGNMFMSSIPGPGWFTKPTTKYEMSADMQVMGSGYLGSLKDALTAENNAGAKLLFGRGKANRMITDAQFRDLQISNIKALRDIDFLTARSMTLNKAMSNQYALLGSYNQSYARVGKFGLKLERAKQLAIKFKEPTNIKELQEVIAMKDGGKFFLDLIAQVDNKPVIDNDTEFFNSLIQSLQEGGELKGKEKSDEERIKYLIETVIKPAAEAGNPTARRLMDLDLTEYTFTEDDVNFTDEDGTKNGYDGKPGDTGNVYVSSRGEYLTPSILYRDGKLVFLGRNPKWTKEVVEQSIKFPTVEDARFFGENYHNYPYLTPALAKHEPKKVKSDKSYYDKDSDSIYYNNDEDFEHEYFHARPNLNFLELLREYYEDLDDEKIKKLGGDLAFVKRFDNDPNYFYSPEELGARIRAAKYMTKGLQYSPEFFRELRGNENKYGDNMRDLLHMYNDENLSKIFNIGNPQQFKDGGQMNVIPEGSLHARLHHMENADNLTKKGIPVVDNEGNQLAEIEHSEIIFTKEVTEKLEELYKKFKSDEYTNKEKEGFAIEAGKLLSKEIIENTDDRVGLLNADKFAEGGIFELPELSSVPPTPAPIYTGELWFRKGFEALTTKYPAQLSLYIMRHAASEGNNKTGYYQLGMNGGNTKNTRKSTDPNSMITYAAELINKYGGIEKFNAVKTWADYLNLLFRPDFMYNEEYSFNPKYSPGKANSYRVNGLIPNEAIDAYKRGYNLNNFVRSLSGPYTSINTWVTNLVNEYNQNNPKNPISNINYTL